MGRSFQVVISASRRTDIPAFYMDWFMAGIRRGFFEVKNPYNGKSRAVACEPGRVHTIVFWSKNFGPFLEGGFGEALSGLGYNLFFNFTVNSSDRLLEPRVPPLEARLGQLGTLAGRFGPDHVQWRFDPICFYRQEGGKLQNNLRDFPLIAKAAAKAGVSRCITSFVDLYPKVVRRSREAGGITFVEPGRNEQLEILARMEDVLRGLGISLHLCCEGRLLESLPPGLAVSASSCIPSDLFMRQAGGSLSLRRDPGQRRAMGCMCKLSTDIGSYADHPCFHDCLFCYANPSKDRGP